MDPYASSSDESNHDELNPTETYNEYKMGKVELLVKQMSVRSSFDEEKDKSSSEFSFDFDSTKSVSLSDEEPPNEGPADDNYHKFYQTDKELLLIGRVKSFALKGVYVFAHENEDVLDRGTLLLLKNKQILGKIGSVSAGEKQIKYFVPIIGSVHDLKLDDQVFCIPNDADITFYAKNKLKRPATVKQDTILKDWVMDSDELFEAAFKIVSDVCLKKQ